MLREFLFRTNFAGSILRAGSVQSNIDNFEARDWKISSRRVEYLVCKVFDTQKHLCFWILFLFCPLYLPLIFVWFDQKMFYYNRGITILRVILVPGPRKYTIIFFAHDMFKLIDSVNIVEKRPDKMSVNVF